LREQAGGTRTFEAAGFRNAFQVDVLPDGARSMDIRYNVIIGSAPLDARLEHWRDGVRPQNKVKINQSDGYARLAAGPADF